MSKSKVAIVTGASRGIGQAVAINLAGRGYDIVSLGKSSLERAQAGLDEIKAVGGRVSYVQGSLADEEARAALLQKAQGMGLVEVLVNNAGMAPRQRLDVLGMTGESLREVLDTNLIGTFLLTQSVANLMVQEKSKNSDYFPSIVNISSISAYTVSLNRAEYCLSKAGISMITDIFAARLAEFGIPVHEVRPGIILTDMTQGVREHYEGLIKEGLLPIKRMGKPQDIARAVEVLTDGSLDYSTGQVIDVDGGFHIRRL
ncbi:MAG: 3-ketoacyl-ACP reductase [Clostridiales bacterium]|nr:3-ketoacyl-ACP reductase [Clostridiales bacterium]